MLPEVSEQFKFLIEQNVKSGHARPVLVNYPKVSRIVQDAVTEVTYVDQNPKVKDVLKTKAQEMDNVLK